VILILVTIVLGGGYAAKTFLMPKKKPPVQKIAGQLVTLTPDFLINLSGGHYGKLTVALQLKLARSAKPGSSVALPEDAAVRANVTDTLTGLSSSDLIDRGRRHALQAQLLHALQTQTDEPVESVLFTDLAVQ